MSRFGHNLDGGAAPVANATVNLNDVDRAISDARVRRDRLQAEAGGAAANAAAEA